MLKEFKEHIEKEFSNLFDSTFLLACSGGIDSVVLTHLCHALKMDFAIAHCNFNLRGAESDSDEDFVKKFAKKLNKSCYITHFDTVGYINKNKVSVQMAARELRYAWFAEIMTENDFETVVTAHQADDNLETFLINLSRGTGLEGLTGIPSKTDTLARPLLPFSREQILAYAKTEKLEWREDSSNSETKYLRNKIRQEVLPKLKELHPTFLTNFKNTQAYLKDTSKVIQHHIKDIKSNIFQKGDGVIKIKTSELQALRPTKAYVHELFREYGFRAWKDIIGLLDGMSGKEVLSKTHRLVKHREYLILEELTGKKGKKFQILENQQEVDSPIKLVIEQVKTIGETGNHILYVDKKTLKYPLIVRNWEKGDYFHPLGMKGRKKVSKYFKDEKMDIITKSKQWLLCSGEDIVWIIGKRPDNRFKVTPDSQNIVKFTFFA